MFILVKVSAVLGAAVGHAWLEWLQNLEKDNNQHQHRHLEEKPGDGVGPGTPCLPGVQGGHNVCMGPKMAFMLVTGDEEEYGQQQHRQAEEEGGLQRPSGARQYRVHKEDQGGPGESSGARQYRVHREGEPSARVERGRVWRSEEDSSQNSGREHSQHGQKPPHRQAFDSHSLGGQSQEQQQGRPSQSKVQSALHLHHSQQ